ncbi:MAG TPA: TonB-dependent receptor [Gemmatimonadaceae bacterium]
MRALHRLIIVASLLVVAPSVLAAQNGTIKGVVTDTATGPVVGAVVTVDASVLLTQTNSRGAYEFRGVSPGSHTVRVRALGHTQATQTVNVAADGTATADFALTSNAVELARVEVLAGSRARHQAADELAVPVDVYTTEQIQQQGTTETGRILAQLSPSVNMPHQSVTDANDIVQPFTLRGLSPDHTLVLINGWRQHQTALLNTFPYGSGAGSSGVDLNAIPAGAIDRIEVLRDGDAADYGSDAIAGVVNIKMKEGQFAPFLNVEGGQYRTADYSADGAGIDINSGVGLKLGRGSLTVFGEFKHDDPTNRAWPDHFLADANGITDDIDTLTGKILHKNNGIAQPNYHWGDGETKNEQTYMNFRMPVSPSGNTEVYAFGGFSHHFGTGNGFWRYLDGNRNWQQIYPQGFLPEFDPTSKDYSVTGGMRTSVGGWSLDFGGSYGLNTFDYNLRNTLNPSLGPCLDVACAPGPDGVFGTSDDPGIPNQTTFFAGRLRRSEYELGINGSKAYEVGLPAPLNVAAGVLFRGEDYAVEQGELASYVNGGIEAQDGSGPAPAGSSVFGGFRPEDSSDHSRTNIGTYLDLETNLTPQFLANVAGRFEHYSDFGSSVSGKLALRYQPAKQFVLRGSLSNGFRAPGLPQSYFSHITTNFIGGQPFEIGNFPVDARAAQIFGAKPLKEEKSVNISSGIAYTPIENFTLTLDYFHIKITDRILLGATFADTVAQDILADSGITGIAGVQFFTNGLDTKTDGIDATANYRMAAGNGTLDFLMTANYTQNKITRVAPLPAVLQGRPTDVTSILDLVTTLGIEKERPDWRGTLTGQYSLSRFHALARASYYGGFTSAQPSFTDAEHYGGKTLVDTEIGYRFNQVNLSIGARNLFDVYPDQAQKEFNNNDRTFPWAAASPFGYDGRYLYTRAEIVLGW